MHSTECDSSSTPAPEVDNRTHTADAPPPRHEHPADKSKHTHRRLPQRLQCSTARHIGNQCDHWVAVAEAPIPCRPDAYRTLHSMSCLRCSSGCRPLVYMLRMRSRAHPSPSSSGRIRGRFLLQHYVDPAQHKSQSALVRMNSLAPRDICPFYVQVRQTEDSKTLEHINVRRRCERSPQAVRKLATASQEGTMSSPQEHPRVTGGQSRPPICNDSSQLE